MPPLQTPETPKEVQDDTKTDVQRSLESSNTFLPNSWISACLDGFSNRLFDNYQNVNDAVNAAFYDTSPEEFLLRQASWYGIFRFDETQSSGGIVIGGTNGEILNAGHEVVSSNGLVFTLDANITIQENNVEPVSILPNGSTAIVTMPSNHTISPGIPVTITGAANVTEGDLYNGNNLQVNVLSPTQFSYQMPDSTVEPATGTINVAWTSGAGAVTSDDFGADTNLDASTPLTVSPEQSGIENQCFVDASGFSGGSDIEDIEDLRNRLLFRVRNPVANFNVAAIENKALEISGVTRVFVFEVTPNIGDVTVYFMRDNDDNPIPNASAVTDVKDSILTIKPANTPDSSVIVEAPTAVTVNFDFSAIVPNTDTMKSAVIEQLKEFFATSTDIAENVLEDQYKTAIYNTVDTVTGDPIQSFSLTSPSGNITVAAGEIAILGTVAFP